MIPQSLQIVRALDKTRVLALLINYYSTSTATNEEKMVLNLDLNEMLGITLILQN